MLDHATINRPSKAPRAPERGGKKKPFLGSGGEIDVQKMIK